MAMYCYSSRLPRAVALLGLTVLVAASFSSQVAQGALTRAYSCNVSTSLVTTGYGAPDDVLVNAGRLYFTDVNAGLLTVYFKGRKQNLFTGLSSPEGVATWKDGALLVAEQGHNRIDRLDLKRKHRSVIIQLRNGTGQEGIDGIGTDGTRIIIPNSPYGRLVRFHNGHFTVLTSRLSRPTDAVRYRGGYAVADENANAVWLVRNHSVQRLATLTTPDDVTSIRGRLLAVTLGDRGLWEVRPHLVRLTGFSNPQGLATFNRNSVIVADSTWNGVYRVSLRPDCFH